MNKSFLKKIVTNQNFSLFFSTLVLFIILTLFSDNSFLTGYNLFNVGRTISLYVFIGLAQVVVLVIGHMNLSVGAIAGLTTIIAGFLMDNLGLSIPVAIILTLIAGILCGLVNGLIITKIGLSSFVTTLATMFIFTGINYGSSKGVSFLNIPKSIELVGRGKIYGMPIILIFTIVVLVIVFIFFSYTIVGRRFLALGLNLEASRFSGINLDKIVILSHMLSGFVAAIGALLFISKMGSASPIIGKDWLIISFAVAIIGGTALNGGRMSPFGILMGAAIMVMIKNGLVLLKLNAYWQQAFLGSMILIAIGIDEIRNYYSKKRKIDP